MKYLDLGTALQAPVERSIPTNGTILTSIKIFIENVNRTVVIVCLKIFLSEFVQEHFKNSLSYINMSTINNLQAIEKQIRANSDLVNMFKKYSIYIYELYLIHDKRGTYEMLIWGTICMKVWVYFTKSKKFSNPTIPDAFVYLLFRDETEIDV